MLVDKQTILILNELGRRYFSSLLDELCIKYSDRGSYVNAACPILSHEGDNNNYTAFSFRYDIGQWACWTHHCEDHYGRDIIGLIRGIKNIPFDKAVSWLKKFIEDKIKTKISDIDINNLDIKKGQSSYELIIHKPIPEYLLKYPSI